MLEIKDALQNDKIVHQGGIMTLNLNTLIASKCMKPRLSEPQRSTTRYINHKSTTESQSGYERCETKGSWRCDW